MDLTDRGGRFALAFDMQGRTFKDISLDATPVGLFSTTSGFSWPLADTTFRLSLIDYSDDNGEVPLTETVLDSVDISSLQGSKEHVFAWIRHDTVLDASGSTTGRMSISWDCVAGGYVVFDNLEILAQDCGQR